MIPLLSRLKQGIGMVKSSRWQSKWTSGSSLLFSLCLHGGLLLFFVYFAQRSGPSRTYMSKPLSMPCFMSIKKKNLAGVGLSPDKNAAPALFAGVSLLPNLPKVPENSKQEATMPEISQAVSSPKPKLSRSTWLKPALVQSEPKAYRPINDSLVRKIMLKKDSFKIGQLKNTAFDSRGSAAQAVSNDYDRYYRGRIFQAVALCGNTFNEEIFLYGEVPSKIMVTITLMPPNHVQDIQLTPEAPEKLKAAIIKFIKEVPFPRRPQALLASPYKITIPIGCEYLQSLKPERRGVWYTMHICPLERNC
jgi:hypothetical protein